MNLIDWAEQGRIPDPLIRWGVRRLSRRRLREEYADSEEARDRRQRLRRREWRAGPIALATEAANAQHYEVPAEFFRTVLGAQLKYSCCLWHEYTSDLDAAEWAMLALYAHRAELADGMRILDLGCGWGSFALWAAEMYPNAHITGVSNSQGQKAFIDRRAEERGLRNLEIVTADINHFVPYGRFDRIVSIEMMEHVRNHTLLFQRIHEWLEDGGRLFSHVFCHRELAYAYEDRGDQDWMSRHFFSGGLMPSYDLFLHYQQHLSLDQRWWLSGTHYEKTSNAWLQRLDAAREPLLRLLAGDLGEAQARIQLQRWRMFFLAVAEFFGIEEGEQWGIGHYLFSKR